ncbi:MAG: hypothetical protein JXA78_04590 [Anaerolineales bacterium]|nr:hypothetical protein [Anaerolineales bacterium]
MGVSRIGNDRAGCGRVLIKWGVVVALLLLFRYELGFLWNTLKVFYQLSQGQAVDVLPTLEETLRLLGYLGFVFAGTAAFSLLVLYLLAEFVLPVRNSDERWKVVERLYYSVLGQRSPVIFIKDGQMPEKSAGKKISQGGVVLVDLDSAIVLEKQWVGGLLGNSGSSNPSKSGRKLARVAGPGLVFIERGEKLRGAVDLRKQFRINLDVLAYTSDGIEVQTHVFAIFTLGYPPTVLKVAYCGGQEAQHLRVLQIDEASQTIRSICDDLDEQDKEEIHRFAQDYLAGNEPSAALEPAETGKDTPPFPIDEGRVFAAVYSRARDASDEKKLDTWADVPARVATEAFRDIISQIRYDDIFLPDDPVSFPLASQVKPAFASAVRRLGVISYQFLQRRDGAEPLMGERIEARSYRVSEVQKLRGSKVLRDRGVKVIHAGFAELRPTDPAIKQQRLDNWRARWQREADLIRADNDLEIIRMRNKARADRQRDMIAKLSQIVQNTAYSEEALTLRIFQALEDVATDPYTQQLLPRDTINMLRSLRLWLLPDDQVRQAFLEDRLSTTQDED